MLTGWEFVQETMLRHDEDMIVDFADDIDTLLVFVSLDTSGVDRLTFPSLLGWSFLLRAHGVPHFVLRPSSA